MKIQPTIDTREWLLTNGSGGFASGTVADVRTRTYHGWLFATTNPPSERKLLLSHIEASLEINNQVINLGANIWQKEKIDLPGDNLLTCFEVDPVPKWVWSHDNWQLARKLIMPYAVGKERENSNLSLSQSLLVEYSYKGKKPAVLKLRLLVGDRNFHHQQIYHQNLQFSQILTDKTLCLQAMNASNFGTPWHLRWTKGKYKSEGIWYWNYQLLEETNRGLSDHEDLFSPGYLIVELSPGETITLSATVGLPNNSDIGINTHSFNQAVNAEKARLNQIFSRYKTAQENITSLPEKLLKAGDQFIVYRASIASPTIIAGYHWFNDWGRDTLISLPGLTLTTGRFDLAKQILNTFGSYCRNGLIPNSFGDLDSEPFYNSIDASLWWIETLGLYLDLTEDWQFLLEEFPVVQQIYKAFIGGTRYNIQVDSTDGLVSWDAPGVALTWMDAIVNGTPITPRYGKPIEINALWYSALCWLSKWAEKLSEIDLANAVKLNKFGERYRQQKEQVKQSLQKFWHGQIGYLYDTIELDDSRNLQIRPNAILALSLSHCAFSEIQGKQILELATERLLTPYGLRSLDAQDPQYIGKYEGDVEKRDRAYHQGTVWSWLIGPYIRAWQRFYPDQPIPFHWKPLLDHFLHDSCLNSISEVFDGDSPHQPRGAVAQAWSVAEVLRHI